VGAGTVEFIAEPTEGPEGGPGGDLRFFFMEMNTRLQVEHPVTEAITGLDLVEWQLLVAQGERLPLQQDQVRWHGSAVECRILAEDADAGFVPDTGQVLLLQEPQGPGVRFDVGVTQGAPVTAGFDSLLAKLVVHGATRELAISRARQALADTTMLGVTINAHYLGRVLAHPAFQAGATDTGFLDRHRADLRPPAWTDEETRALVAVAAAVGRDPFVNRLPEPYASMGAWHN
jgi:acetyl/propionyl-CoA carboxylase alpha subunit